MEPLAHTDIHVTSLTKIDFFGQHNPNKPLINTFDHREELEDIAIPLASCHISTLTLWFSSGDIQNLALRGIKANFKKMTEGHYFDSLDYLVEKAKLPDKDNKEPDLLHFEVGEYIKSLNLVISETNGLISGLEFTTTASNRKVNACGIIHNPDASVKLPAGKQIIFDFLKENQGFLVGFYGEYDNEYITYLGGYVASIKNINYHIRRPYIIGYKMLLKDKEVGSEIRKKLGIEYNENGKIKEAKLNDNSSKVLYYLYDAGATNYDLVRNVFEYLI